MVLWQHAMLCNVMLRRVPSYGYVFCASLRDTGHGQYHVAKHIKCVITSHNTTTELTVEYLVIINATLRKNF